MSASDKSPSLESNGNATKKQEQTALKLLERVYAYIRHEPQYPDRMVDASVSLRSLTEQIEDLIATQHAPSVGPGNEAGAAQVSEKMATELRDKILDALNVNPQMPVALGIDAWILDAIQVATASLRSEPEQAREALRRIAKFKPDEAAFIAEKALTAASPRPD